MIMKLLNSRPPEIVEAYAHDASRHEWFHLRRDVGSSYTCCGATVAEASPIPLAWWGTNAGPGISWCPHCERARERQIADAKRDQPSYEEDPLHGCNHERSTN